MYFVIREVLAEYMSLCAHMVSVCYITTGRANIRRHKDLDPIHMMAHFRQVQLKSSSFSFVWLFVKYVFLIPYYLCFNFK